MVERDANGGFYHLHVKNIGRRFGRSVVAAAAYRAGETVWNDAEERESVFIGRRDVLHAEICLPSSAPVWAGDRTTLWNAVEAAEKRKDARLAKEIEFALPRELARDQWVTVVREMADAYTAQGFIVDMAIHEDGRGHNPHAHLLLTLRDVGPDGFGLKIRQADSKSFVVEARRRWEKIANAALGKAGSAVQIDARSYRARGIARRPGKHRGPDPLERRGNRTIAAAVRELLMADIRDGEALRAMLRDKAHERYVQLHRRDDSPPIDRAEPVDLSSSERPEFLTYWRELDTRKADLARSADRASTEGTPERSAPTARTAVPERERGLTEPDRLPVSERALAQLQDLEQRLHKRMGQDGHDPGGERDWVAWQEGFDAFRAQLAEVRDLEARNALFEVRETERARRAERFLPVPDKNGDLVPEAQAQPVDDLAWARSSNAVTERQTPAAPERDELDWIPGRGRVSPERDPDIDRER